MEWAVTSRSEREMTPLEQAQTALDWLPNYMYDWTDVVEELPALARERLVGLFGSEQTNDHLSRLKTVFGKIPAEHQANVGLFIAGYPDDAVTELSEVSIDQTLTILRGLLNLHISDSPVSYVGESLPLRVVAPLSDAVDEARELSRRLDFTTSREGLEWQDDALCAQTDPEVFFPEKGGSARDGKKVCSQCQVRGDCLEYALLYGERFGIWGGLSEKERRRMSARGKRMLVSIEQNAVTDTTS